MGQGHQTLFLIVSVAAIAVLVYFFAFSGRRRGYQVVLGLLLAGVLGNLYDRLAFGYVRDMLHLFPGVHWGDLLAALPQRRAVPVGLQPRRLLPVRRRAGGPAVPACSPRPPFPPTPPPPPRSRL